MPDKNDTTNVKCNYKDVLHCVLGNDSKVFYWMGDDPAQETTFSNSGIRNVLLSRRNHPRLTVLIKPRDDSKYQSMVDILDEMTITKIDRYAVVDFSDDDKMKLADIAAKLK